MADSEMDELDRLAARSLAAREADAQASAPPRRNVLPWALAGLLFTFVLGMIASPWFERQVRGSIPGGIAAAQQIDADPRVDALIERVTRLEAMQTRESVAMPAVPAAESGTLAERLAALEARAAALQQADGVVQSRIEGLASEISQTSGAIAEGDARIRDLFLVSVARRMLDAGRPLTALQPALAARFQLRDAKALEQIAAWSAAPQTLQTLQDRLPGLQADSAVLPQRSENLWERLKARLSGLVQVKDADEARPPTPQARVADAQSALAAGDLGLATTLVDPIGTAAARQWAADARLLLAARDAVARLDGFAIEAALADPSVVAARQAAALPYAPEVSGLPTP